MSANDASDPPGLDQVGREMSDELRPGWVELALAIHRASSPGGPLEGFVFHGTSAEKALAIREDGVAATQVMLRHEDEAGGVSQYWGYGTYWATAWVAAFYAEDHLISRGDPRLPLAFIAARLDDVASEGELVPDEQTLDSPIVSRLNGTEEDLWSNWGASDRSWDDCYRLYGSFVCLSSVGAEAVQVIEDIDDLRALIDRVMGEGCVRSPA